MNRHKQMGANMEHNSSISREYLRILEQELVPAFGCTEPIAIAYAAALAAQTLGERPDRLLVEASGNIIKNVRASSYRTRAA